MKRTFKSIMFVAAAAMAFTACNVEPVETPDEPTGTHTVKFVASQVDTKTTMGINDRIASFAWEDTDKAYFHIFENGAESDEIDAEIVEGVMNISAIFSDSESPYTYTGFMAATVSNDNPAVSNVQKDLGAYDPDSDILVAKPVTDKTPEDILEGILFQFKRVVAINQMTLKGLTEGETVTGVTITSDKPIAGEYDFANGAWNASQTSISIVTESLANADGQAVVYFVCAPVDGAQLTVTATTAEGKTYSKELAKTISFAEGGVKFFGVTVAEDVPARSAYKKVTSEPSDWSGQYLLVYESSDTEGLCWTGVDAPNCYAIATIDNDEISEIPEGAVTLTIASTDGGYSIKVNGGDNDGKFIYGVSGSNALTFNTAAQLNTIRYSDDRASIVSNTSVMRFNSASNNMRFRYFKSSTYESQQPVQLYKYNGTIDVIPVTGVSLSKTELALEVGATETLFSTVLPENATNKSVTWTSNNESVATVADGVVIGVAAGEATITVTTVDGEFTATCNVTVTAPSIYSTIADIMSKGPGSYSVENAVVMAKAGSNVILGDGTANIMLYHSGNSLEVGNVITITNKEVAERNGLYQFAIEQYDVAEEKVTPEYGTPVEIMNDTDVVGWSGEPQYQYIHFKGSMQSDNRTIKCGEKGIYIASTTGFSGMNVEVYGYANGKMSSYGTITTTLVSIEEYEAVIPVETVTLNNTELTLNVGATSTLSATVAPVTATNKNVSWSSSNPAVATVSDGVVTAIAVGTATITVTTEDGSKTATCAVTVTAGGDTTDYSAVYTSNVTLSTEGGTSASAAKVKINEIEYDAIKAGTGKVTGACLVSIPATTKTLHFHAMGWNGETVIISVNGSSYSLTSDSGVSNNSPFTLTSTDGSYFTLNPAGATTITFSATTGKRFVIWGVNAE